MLSFLALHLTLAALETAPTRETVTNSIGMKLVLIPAGEFMMGASEDAAKTLARFPYAKASWLSGETPRHHVRITRPFLMGIYEVTLGQFLAFYHDAHYKLECERTGRANWGYDGRNKLVRSRSFSPWSPAWQIDNRHPAVYVTWADATAFCDWLSQKEGSKYRLPTEAEWEYACRAGTETLYYNGDNPQSLPLVGNVADAATHAHWPNSNLVIITSKDKKRHEKIPFPYLSVSDGYAYTAPVGSFRPNAFGLYDMHGNVWEWCSDYYARDYYAESPEDDPPGPAAGSQRVLRGGGWFNAAVRVRSSDRASSPPGHSFYMWGFRVVSELPAVRLELDALKNTL